MLLAFSLQPYSINLNLFTHEKNDYFEPRARNAGHDSTGAGAADQLFR